MNLISGFGLRTSTLESHSSPPIRLEGLFVYDDKTVQRFIELRSLGRTYQQLETELNVSKTTLITWSRKYQFQIQNLKAIELEALADKWLGAVSVRVNTLGDQLQKVETELASRDLKDLSTARLYSLALRLRRQIEQSAGPVRFTSPVAEIPGDEYHDQVQDWNG